MGDENTAHEEEVETTDTGADDTDESTTEDESDTSQNSDDEDAADDAADEGTDDDGKGSSDDESDNADDDEPEDDDSEPELRKPQKGASNAEWAAWRAQQKAKAQKSGKDSEEADDDAEDSDDDELSPEDAKAIDKRIEKHLEPFKKVAAEQEVDAEIATFLETNPDFKPYAAKARRWALHRNRQNVPVKAIFYEIAGDKLMAIGAKRAKAADAKAQKTKSAGGRTGGEQGNKSYKDMPLKDFGQELEAAKLRR